MLRHPIIFLLALFSCPAFSGEITFQANPAKIIVAEKVPLIAAAFFKYGATNEISIEIWNWQTGIKVTTIKTKHEPFSWNNTQLQEFKSLEISPDGEKVAIGFDWGPLVQVYEIKTGKLIFEKDYEKDFNNGDWGAPSHLKFDGSSKNIIIFSAGMFNFVDTYDIQAGTRRFEVKYQGDTNTLVGFGITSDNSTLITLKKGGFLDEWAMADGAKIISWNFSYNSSQKERWMFPVTTKFDPNGIMHTRMDYGHIDAIENGKLSELPFRNDYGPMVQLSIYQFWMTSQSAIILGDGPVNPYTSSPSDPAQNCLRFFSRATLKEEQRFCYLTNEDTLIDVDVPTENIFMYNKQSKKLTTKTFSNL